VRATDPNTELGLISTPPGAYLAEALAETVHAEKHISVNGHVGADRISNRRYSIWQAAVIAADNPLELLREPPWSSALPAGLNPATDPQDRVVRMRANQLLGPVLARLGIIIKERHYIATGPLSANVPC
jgi:hypothetical protein